MSAVDGLLCLVSFLGGLLIAFRLTGRWPLPHIIAASALWGCSIAVLTVLL